ncbi:hypothetical protein GHT06_007978 [Daphnia sinensis]|uniref:Coenzyme Q-binding protein COQ10 START domain-containing protein n=1 Tax=Daphnia sinensis TaxID=1820382 RepID=A0AAD5Q2A6_9CRUS|nr:hypothetical protein GHT06_007978 [Daphnia sinensis]
MLQNFSLPLTIFHGCKTQLNRKNVISFSRKCLQNQCISTQATGQRHLDVRQDKFSPRRSLHREFKAMDVFIPNRGFKLSVPLRKENKRRDFSEKILLGYSMEQLFNIVSDVEHYKDFIPYCTSSVVTSHKTPCHLIADLSFGFPPFPEEGYTSSFTLTSPTLVKSVCVDRELFNHMVTIWKFSPGLNGNPNTCILDFYLSYEFRSLFHTHLSRIFSDLIVGKMITAYSAEAKRRYGAASPVKAYGI